MWQPAKAFEGELDLAGAAAHGHAQCGDGALAKHAIRSETVADLKVLDTSDNRPRRTVRIVAV
jgi:hypothetical protein